MYRYKMKKGKRNISLDGAKALSCSPIITEYLPDYPTRDERTEFADNGYRANDSVTICGWLKDMPELAKKQNGGTFRLALSNLLADEQEDMIDRDLERGRMYVLEEDETIVGTGTTIMTGEKECEIIAAFLLPEAIGHGLGRKLFDFACGCIFVCKVTFIEQNNSRL
mgnify:CR=1 FL=1